MKRIAVVAHGASGGGSERVATILANYFAQLGHDVFFYALHSEERGYYLDERVHYCYCTTSQRAKPLRMAERMWKLNRFLKRNKIETMVSFIYTEGLAALGNRRLKKIYSLRNDPSHAGKQKYEIWARNRLYRDADTVVFQTPDARAYFDEKIQQHGVVIPNPIKENLPYWKADNSRKEILAVGRLSKQKNFALLLDAFAQFHERHPEYCLTICGEGELRSALEMQAQQLGIADKVNLPGFLSNVHERMTEAEMFVSTSDYEGISNAMLEAMAIGLPVVCTDCPIGGAAMFIHSGENGFLFPVGDGQALAECMEKLCADTALRKEFSVHSQSIRQTLAISRICSQWAELID